MIDEVILSLAPQLKLKPVVIDIDCPEYSDEITNILNSHPYTGSSTKDYGRHIFVQDMLYDPHNQRPQFKQQYGKAVELLAGQWPWCPINENVHNANYSFEVTGLESMIETSRKRKKTRKKKTKHTKRIEHTTPENMEARKKDIRKSLLLNPN